MPIVDRKTFEAIKSDVAESPDLKTFAEDTEDRLRLENNDLYCIIGFFANNFNWSEDQVTAARHAMSLTYEVLRRQAQSDLAKDS